MDIKQAAQVIRDQVTMDQILSLYGYRTKKGFMCCPFHGEKEPSLKVYKDTGGWHCFGCGKGGSVIDFVMEHENCPFPVAVRAIDHALKLGLMDRHEMPEDANIQKRIQNALDKFVDGVNAYIDAMYMSIDAQQLLMYKKLKRLEEVQYGHAEDLTADDYTFLLTWKEEDLYMEYRKDKIMEFREEVAAWRRKARKAT